MGKQSKAGTLELSEEEAEAAVDSVLRERLLELSVTPGSADRMAQLRALRGKGKGGKKAKKAKGGKKGRPFGLSNDDAGRRTMNLAVELDEARGELDGVQAELAEQRWLAECATTFKGVPKAFLDLAQPVLASPSAAVLSLANGDGEYDDVDAAQVIRDMLAIVPRLDLSEPDGLADELGADDDPTLALDKEWDSLSGAVV